MEAPQLLLRKLRGLSSNRTLTWLACVPIALMGLGLFKAASLWEV
jgi:Amt family ammonium transporter